MDLNVAVPTTPSELFEENDMVFPILMGRENLKILASPGSESSGVSSLDADEAKKLANDQLATSSSPTLSSSNSSSAVQTESESSDGGSDGDDDKPIEESPKKIDNAKLIAVANEENEEDQLNTNNTSISTTTEAATSDDEDKDDLKSEKNIKKNEHDETNECQTEQLVTGTAESVQHAEMAAMIDLKEEIRYKNLTVMYEGRNVLDFGTNVANKSWNVQYAHLPEKNYQMYINNRSQYNRLSSGYESPEHYALNACGKCAFYFPVLNVDVPEKIVAQPNKLSVSELLTQTVLSIVSRDSPIQNFNALAQKLSAQTMHMHGCANNAGQSLNMNNFMLNNGNSGAAVAAAVTSAAQSYAYQNRNQFANGATATNNHTCYKHANNSNNNAIYGTNNIVLNALVNQIGNNMNNSSGFNSNFMNAINGTNTNNAAAGTNQLNNATLANFINQNRQQLFNYGVCRQNINKSGINFNANSHKPMPTYSHF